MSRIIERDRSVIPACDVDLETFGEIVRETTDVDGIGGYKVGVSFLDVGLARTVEIANEYTDKPIIYDHQKAGTDIHEKTPQEFMDAVVRAGINAVILFPQAGPITEYEWIRAAQERELGVIVGGEMTHPRFLEGDTGSGKAKDYDKIFANLGFEPTTTGFIRSSAPKDMYQLAALMDATDFVVPGNKPDRIGYYKRVVEEAGVTEPAFYSPGLVSQGGDISEGAEAAGERFHAIVGRGIYWNKAEDRYKTSGEIREAAEEHTSQL